ncbi:hypothetical protein B0H17DRAFT_1201093 [Mycena rosella]|uniref:Uncharacterized protein n=1 Tax=Mycena rosella TaxID=1033263 RepID=A0AAD7GHR8_MYCRO|nr:hypothetical protein B0H17DRAFT_1201093 [Mycena rosella]
MSAELVQQRLGPENHHDHCSHNGHQYTFPTNNVSGCPLLYLNNGDPYDYLAEEPSDSASD